SQNLAFFIFGGDTECETSARIGAPAVTSTGNLTDPSVTAPTATQSPLLTDVRPNIVSSFCQLALLPKNVCNHSLPARAITLHSLRQSRAGQQAIHRDLCVKITAETQTALCIAGTHRSGTSTVTRLLHCCGLEL